MPKVVHLTLTLVPACSPPTQPVSAGTGAGPKCTQRSHLMTSMALSFAFAYVQEVSRLSVPEGVLRRRELHAVPAQGEWQPWLAGSSARVWLTPLQLFPWVCYGTQPWPSAPPCGNPRVAL